MVGFLKNKKYLLIALLLVLAGAAAFAAVHFLSQGKSARDFYFKAESKNYRLYADWIKKNYTEFMDKEQPYLTAEYESRTELTASASSTDAKPFGLGNTKGIFDVLSRCKLIFDTKYSPTAKTSLSDISLLLEKTPFADARIFSKDRQLYMTVPVLTPDRYFTLNMDKFGEVYDRFGIPVKPQKIPSPTEAAKILAYDPAGLDKGMTALGDFITGIIGDADVKYGKNATIMLENKKVGVREVLVKLDEIKSGKLVRGLAGKYAADQTLVGMTFGNAAGISALLDQAGLFELFEYLDKTGVSTLNDSERKLLSAVNIKNDPTAFMKNLTDTANMLYFPRGMNMTLNIDRAGNILDRKLNTTIIDKRTNTCYSVSIHTGATSLSFGDLRNRLLEVTVDNSKNNGKFDRNIIKFNSLFGPSGDKNSEGGRIEASWSTEKEGVQQGSIGMTLYFSNSTDPTTLKRTDTCKYTILMKSAGMDSNVLEGEIATDSWSNKKLNTRNWSTNVTVKASMPSFGTKDFSAALKLAREDKLGIGAFELPAVNPSTTVDLNTATDEELSRVQNEILTSFGVFYMTNKPIIDAMLGK